MTLFPCLCLYFAILTGSFIGNDPLPSWNPGPAKQSILDFVAATTNPVGTDFVPPEERIATFDQDGTLWVEHPLYTQFVYCLDRVKELAKETPELGELEPFKSVIAEDRDAIDRFTLTDWKKIIKLTLSGMTVDTFAADVKAWLARAVHPRWNRPYTELTYQPMQELLRYLRANGFKTYIVTGGGQDFVRVYSQEAYGVPPEQVIGSAGVTKFRYNRKGKAELIKLGEILFSDNYTGKPEGIHLMIGRRPIAAFGNSTGDQQMLEFTEAGEGRTLMMLVLHDDAEREYAYGPAEGLPKSNIGTFTQELFNEAVKRGWPVISMKRDWNRIFSFDQ